MQHINNLLRAPDGKRRDDDLALLAERAANQPADGGVGILADGVFASAVGGFNLEVIHVFHRHRVAENFIAAAAHVATEQPAEFAPASALLRRGKPFFLNVQHDLGGAEDVPGIAERHGHAIHGRERIVVGMADELFHGLLGVGHAIKRFDGRLMFFRPPFGNEKRVLFLYVRGVNQHDAAEVARGVGAMDGAVVALPGEVGQVAGVVNVCMAQDHGVNLPRVERKTAVALRGFLTMPLEQTAFEQEPFAVDLEEIHRAGGGARRPQEMDFHF